MTDREAFEAWTRETKCAAVRLAMVGDEYESEPVQFAWEGWQAAIAADRDALRERVKVLEGALSEVLEFQSAPTRPNIHDWGRWRRARAALEAK